MGLELELELELDHRVFWEVSLISKIYNKPNLTFFSAYRRLIPELARVSHKLDMRWGHLLGRLAVAVDRAASRVPVVHRGRRRPVERRTLGAVVVGVLGGLMLRRGVRC